MSSQQSKSTLDGMPKQFVSSLKVLFDILDEEKSGLVSFSTIESRWQDGEVTGLPNGVLEALKKVTPSTGKLTFERFVAGLKIALLRNKGGSASNSPQSSGNAATGGLGPKPDLLSHDTAAEKREPSPQTSAAARTPLVPDFAATAPLPGSKNFAAPGNRGTGHKPTTAAVRPNNALANQRSGAAAAAAAGANLPDPRSAAAGGSMDITPPPTAGPTSNQPPPSAPALRNDPFLQDPLPGRAPIEPRTEPRRVTPPIWNPTQSQYNDPYNNRNVNSAAAHNTANKDLDAHGRSKDDVVFALKKWKQNKAGPSGSSSSGGGGLTDDQRLQSLGRGGATEGRASIALASFENYGEKMRTPLRPRGLRPPDSGKKREI